MGNSTKVGENIRRIRRDKGLTLEQVAARAGTDTGNLSRLERGLQGYTDEGLRLIAHAMDVDVRDFFGAERATEPLPPPYNRTLSQTVTVSHFRVPASMGGGIDIADDVVVDDVQLNSKWIASKLPQVTDPRQLAFITGYGDSMEETFFHGDVLFIDRSVRELKVDAIYVFELERELFIKRLQRLPGGAVKVISDNRKYESFVVDGGKPGRRDMHILGRVVGAWNWRPL